MSYRVLHLTSMQSTKYGAIERYLLEVVRCAAARGGSSTVQYEAEPESAAYLRDLREVGAEVVVERLQTCPLRAARSALRLLRRERPDVIHSHFLRGHLLLLLPTLASLAGSPRTIHTVHSNPFGVGRLRLRLSYSRYDHVLPSAEAVRRTIVSSGLDARHIVTWYQGLIGEYARSSARRAEIRRELGIPDAATVLGNIAFDAPVKGVDVLLRALSQLVPAYPNVYLLQVGIRPEDSELPALAQQLGVDQHVRWAGIRDFGWEWLDGADLYVNSSRSEGLPYAVLEAMALSLPIVATRVAGVPEQVVDGETGYLTQPDDPDALVAAVNRALADRARWPALGSAGRRRYEERFRGEPSAAALVDRYYGEA